MSIFIVTDSTCDLPEELIKKNKITVLPIYINMDGKSFRDGIDISRQQFYKKLPGQTTPTTTSVMSVENVETIFNNLIKKGATSIISIHIASSLSNMVNVVRLAAKRVKSIPIEVVDTGQLTLGVGFLVLKAVNAIKEGKKVKEIVPMINNMASRTWSFALLSTLDYIHRGGRVSLVQYQIGRILNIKPVLIMHEGVMKLEKAFTFSGSIRRVTEIVSKLKPIEQIGIVHANALKHMDELRRSIDAMIQVEIPHLISEVTPAIGVHVGPGGVGLICVKAEE
jgi:DegV family protein with EDD domain